jgi:ribosomal protein L7Ae-like RNA K-turn-binding protein
MFCFSGGLDSKILDLISLCKENNTPYAFCIGRRKLGKIFMKKVPVSCAAIVNADGAEVIFNI